MIATATTLSRYISRQFAVNFGVLLLILLGVVYVFDTVELMRRGANYGVPFRLVLSMAALKLPEIGQRIIPFGVLFAAIYTCWKLNKTHELVVIRAAGLSAWQFLSPMILTALAIGTLSTAVLNPVSSLLLGKFTQMEIVHLNKDDNLLTVSRTGIWLRQPVTEAGSGAQAGGYALLRANNFDQGAWTFTGVTLLFFDADNSFRQRVDAPVAQLQEGFWEMRDAQINRTEGKARPEPRFLLPTELTATRIEESFADPETISFWHIPEYLNIMEESGLPSTRLRIYFQALLAQPFLMAAMVLLAATFSLRPPRFGGTGIMIALGVLVGFFIFFMESMLHAFGISQKIPVYLAAWTPALISLMLGATALLHMEDG